MSNVNSLPLVRPHLAIYTSSQSHKHRGFAYGLLDILNPHFQTSLSITAGRASGLSAAYFGAYFLCPPTILGWIPRKWGFRVTFMSGLAIISVGCLMWCVDAFSAPLSYPILTGVFQAQRSKALIR